MHCVRIAAIASAILAASPQALGQPIECAGTVADSSAAAAFEAFCGRCHQAEQLAAGYFGGADGSQAAMQREGELAAFLDRHSGCPHRHHEAIAAWLRQLSATR